MVDTKLTHLNDQETAVDLLYYEAIARTVVSFITQSKAGPLTIGVHGDWGAGKSSILKMVSGTFVENDRVLCIWFNGWSFEGFEDAKAVILETLVEELRRARSSSAKVAEAAAKLLRRIDWLKVARKGGGVALTAMTGIPAAGIVEGLFAAAQNFVQKPQDHISAEDARSVFESAGEYIKAAGKKNETVPEHIHKFRQEFEELLDAADIDQLVVLIDDLDRCLPATAIATLEAIRLFLFVPKTAFVIAADEAMIEYSVRQHFPDLPHPAPGTTSYARSYLEKLIQVPFRIPALGLSETRAYITLLLSGSALGETDEQFKKLIDAAREDLRRPWISSGLSREIVQKALSGTLPAAVDDALRVSEQIARPLSEGTRGNPRQIKRFLNSLILRRAVAEARGFGEEIHIPALAKIMLAEQFLPDFYEFLARNAASNGKGSVPLLVKLEEKSEVHGASKLKDEGDDEPDGWLKNENVREWARIEPLLQSIDLRPYIFVSRDKRSYFTGVVAPDHLEGVIERLMGGKVAVRMAEGDVAKLTPVECEQVFDVIRERITASDKLGSKPAGVDGLVLLVRKNPAMQRKLLSFLKGLPTDKTGAWAASGWVGCFNDKAVSAEFDELRASWGTQATNAGLKAAASAAPKVRGT